MTANILAWTNLTLAMVIVGSSVVFGKVITQTFPVFLASGLRFGIASLVMLPLMMASKKALFQVSRKDAVRIVIMAFCGQFVFTVLMLLGLRYTSAIEAGIITSTSPAMMALVAFLVLKERPGPVQAAAVGLVVAGVISVNIFGSSAVDISSGAITGSHLAGNLMIVGAVVGEAVFLLMRKQISSEISNLDLTGYLCLSGAIFFLPFSISQAASFDFSSVPPTAWGAIVYFGAVFTVLAYLFWFNGVARVSGATAGIFSAVMPVSAVVLSCIFLGEQFTLAHGIGLGLVVTGIVAMALAGSRKVTTVKT